MSTSVMVANASCRDGEDDKKLRFDKNQADYSARKIKMHLMKKNSVMSTFIEMTSNN